MNTYFISTSQTLLLFFYLLLFVLSFIVLLSYCIGYFYLCTYGPPVVRRTRPVGQTLGNACDLTRTGVGVGRSTRGGGVGGVCRIVICLEPVHPDGRLLSPELKVT